MYNIIINEAGKVVAVTLVLMLAFVLAEGTVVSAQTTTFEIEQVITGEIAFVTAASDVAMSPSIAALSGGSANGQTQVAVRTNDPDGYTMTIAFSTATAMQRTGGSGSIANYTPVAASDYNFDTSATGGEFAYSIAADVPTDANALFRDNGTSACGSGSNSTVGRCWVAPSTTAQEVVDRSSATGATGATTTIDFRVYVPSTPSPTIPAGTYTATATLTATAN